MPWAWASAAARSQPVTPPMRCTSGITKSSERSAMARAISKRVHQVLAGLDGRGRRGRDARVALVVVVAHRLLDPVEPLAVEGPRPAERLVDGQPLVEVAHQRGPVADPLLHRAHRGQVLGEVVAPHPQLDRAGSPPRAAPPPRRPGVSTGMDPEAGAVVGGDGARRPAQQRDQREAVRTGPARPTPPCRGRPGPGRSGRSGRSGWSAGAASPRGRGEPADRPRSSRRGPARRSRWRAASTRRSRRRRSGRSRRRRSRGRTGPARPWGGRRSR